MRLIDEAVNLTEDKKECRKLKKLYGCKRKSTLAWIFNHDKLTIPKNPLYQLAKYMKKHPKDLIVWDEERIDWL